MLAVVCIKQVPDTTEIKIDPEKGTLVREGIPAVINPTDLNATEEALKLKDSFGAKVVAVTMGPPRPTRHSGSSSPWGSTGPS